MKIIEANLGFRNELDGRKITDTIVLHHAEASECTIQDIHRWHLGRGWSGCGYHYFIRKDGTVYRGRQDNTIGAQCKGHNSHTVGICLEGNYMSEDVPKEQLNSTIELCSMLNEKYGKLEIKGHRELFDTDCPGGKFPLDKIIQNVGQTKIIGGTIMQREFINKIAPAAVKSMKEYGVLASITIAQAILESGWGRSTLSSKYKNFFGVKAHRWNGEKIEMKTAEYTKENEKYHIKAEFRVYGSVEESIKDHGRFLVENRRYRENGVFRAKDYKEQAQALLKAGYATSPEYAYQLIELIEMFKLNQYDEGYNPHEDTFQTSGKIELNILKLQKFLNSQNIKDFEEKLLAEDGILGKRTRSSFKKLKEVII